MSDMTKACQIMIAMVVMLFSIECLGSNDMILNQKDIISLETVFEENEIYFKNLSGLEYDGHGNIYYLDGHFVRILKVEANTFKLVDTISSRGQGPTELQNPIGFKIKGDLIYVYDLGFGGVKVFDLNGKLVKGFKIPVYSFSFNMFLYHIIDVNSKNELYVRHIDDKRDTVVSVFNMNGNMIRQIIPLGADRAKEMQKWFISVNFEFLIDQQDNMIILYKQGALLKKFTPKGKLIWERNLYQDLPADLRRNTSVAVKKSSRSVNITNLSDFFGMCFIEGGNIFLSCHKIGMVYDTQGKLAYRISRPDQKSFGKLFTWNGGRLYTADKIYKIKNR